MIINPTEQEMKKSICHFCHWKDENSYLCHAIEPPRKIDFAIDNSGDCYYIPETYWDRISQERKTAFEIEKERRSKSYYKNK